MWCLKFCNGNLREGEDANEESEDSSPLEETMGKGLSTYLNKMNSYLFNERGVISN